MLSFDFTDREVKIVKGLQKGGKLIVQETTTIEIPEGHIVNGFIQSPQQLAELINQEIRNFSFNTKEAVASISSSQISFREVTVNKQKSGQMASVIKAQIQKDLSIDNSFSVGFTIISENRQSEVVECKALAFASPSELILSYRKLFSYMGIQLKSISAATTCIAKIVLSDARNKQKMPLIAVQIDKNFLNFCLFENGQLSLARYLPIQKDDIQGDNYLMSALNDNVFRIIQFVKSRVGQTVRDVIFYGDVSDYFSLARTLEQQDLRTSVLVVPPNINGYERIEFTQFANAIGAMYKNKKDSEKVNFLQGDGSFDSSQKPDIVAGGIPKNVIISAVFTLLIVGAIWLYLFTRVQFVESESEEIQTKISSTQIQDKLKEYNKILTQKNETEKYFKEIDSATNALVSRRCITPEVLTTIYSTATPYCSEVKFSYNQNTITLDCKGKSQEAAANLVEALNDTNMFIHVSYTGFKSESALYQFTVTMISKAGEQ